MYIDSELIYIMNDMTKRFPGDFAENVLQAIRKDVVIELRFLDKRNGDWQCKKNIRTAIL